MVIGDAGTRARGPSYDASPTVPFLSGNEPIITLARISVKFFEAPPETESRILNWHDFSSYDPTPETMLAPDGLPTP
jgi:hypothetical protein